MIVRRPAPGIVLYGADCLDVLRCMPSDSIDSICTDPPAGIAFMGKEWDGDKGGRDAWIAWLQEIAAECLRVVKPGGHALVWSLPRTSHWTGMAWENAGWEPRDKITHIFGSGMPHSLAVNKSIEAKLTTGSANKKDFKHLAGEQVERGGWGINEQQAKHGQRATNYDETTGPTRLGKLEPTTEEARKWEGWGTALKPASEDWWLLRKPLAGTVANSLLTYGTGAINIDGCRVGTDDNLNGGAYAKNGTERHDGTESWRYKRDGQAGDFVQPVGRWPANLVHDGSDEVVAGFPVEGGGKGSASRFFYCTKASVKDREEGLAHLPDGILAYSNGAQAAVNGGSDEYTGGSQDIGLNKVKKRKNTHPTVKNRELMRYLTRLVTPKGGVCLDPFMGSGSTGKACVLEGFRFIGIDTEPTYVEIAEGRIKHAHNSLDNGETEP